MCKYSARSALQHVSTYRPTNLLLSLFCLVAEHVKVFKLNFKYLHIYSTKVAIFAEKNSRIASLMPCQRSVLRKTVKCIQSEDFEGIQ